MNLFVGYAAIREGENTLSFAVLSKMWLVGSCTDCVPPTELSGKKEVGSAIS